MLGPFNASVYQLAMALRSTRDVDMASVLLSNHMASKSGMVRFFLEHIDMIDNMLWRRFQLDLYLSVTINSYVTSSLHMVMAQFTLGQSG